MADASVATMPSATVKRFEIAFAVAAKNHHTPLKAAEPPAA